jgi:hypothetical protein
MGAPDYFAENYDTRSGLFAEMFCRKIKIVNHEGARSSTKESKLRLSFVYLRG